MSDYCVDSGVLIALYSRRDQRGNKERAGTYMSRFENRANKIALPWPVMYEALNSAIALHRSGMEMFARHLRAFRKSGQLIEIDDRPYRGHALNECMAETLRTDGYRGLSLVDRVLRLMLNDRNLRFNGLITFNERDFADVCRGRKIELLGRA